MGYNHNIFWIRSKIINKLLTEVKPYYDLGKIREGKKLEIIFDLNNNLEGISFNIDKITKLQIVSLDNSFKVFFYKKPYKTKNNTKNVNPPNNAEIKLDILFNLIKNIIDIIVIKKIR